MIKIVDYGLGNIGAFLNMYTRMNILAEAAKVADDLASASKIILPGVGAFDQAMLRLNASGMRSVLEHKAAVDKIPTLGICVGMQMLAGKSEEGNEAGLSLVPGRVRAFKSVQNIAELPLPHMGWNDVQPTPATKLFESLEIGARFYFLHSYYFECELPENEVATCDYGISFSCAVQHKNVCGVQFHPEKSHRFGAQLLKNFAEI